MSQTPRIGLTANFFHADPQRNLFKGKTLIYIEEGMAHYLMSMGAMVHLVPTASTEWSYADIVGTLDGLVLHGGADVAPKFYGEEPLKPEWAGDAIRDEYELALVKECIKQDKPVFGICRGVQLINVAFGGTLYQDINAQVEGSLVHRNWHLYEDNKHVVELVEGTRLQQVYGATEVLANSVHHQAVKKVGEGLVVEARSKADGIIEAVRNSGDAWVQGIQWHPEFQRATDTDLLAPEPVLEDFMAAIRERMV